VGEKQFEEITLEVYFKAGKEKSLMYEDAEDGYDYNKGRYCLTTFTLNGKEDQLTVAQHQEGKFETGYSRYRIVLHGVPFKVKKIRIDNEKVAPDAVMAEKNVLIVDKNFSELHITG
jgi:alpha-glucosidase